MGLARRRHGELGKATITFAADSPAFIGAIIHVAAQHVAHQNSLANACGIDIRADGCDMAADVRPLNAGEAERRARPAGVSVVNRVEPLGPTGIGCQR